MEYHYQARDIHSKPHRGILTATNRSLAVQALQEQGLYPIFLQEQTSPGRWNQPWQLSAPLSARERILFTRQLSTMLNSGIPLLSCLETLNAQTGSRPWRSCLAALIGSLEHGQDFGTALSQHPKIFPPLYASMVRTGEFGGKLSAILDKLGDWLERDYSLRQKLRTASIYPLILAGFTLIVLFGILTYIIPLFTDLFRASGHDLPALTRILLALSDYLHNHFSALILLALILIIGWNLLRRWPPGRYYTDWLSLRLPLLGTLYTRVISARFAHSLGTLLQAGVPLLSALPVVSDTIDNHAIRRTLEQTRRELNQGQSLSAPLVASGSFSPVLTRIIAAGEESGELGTTLLYISTALEKESADTAAALIAIMEPLMIIIAAILVGLIIGAVLLPVFELTTAIG